jgi:2-iminobutanoate/2-iminopropanoate deaminase
MIDAFTNAVSIFIGCAPSAGHENLDAPDHSLASSISYKIRRLSSNGSQEVHMSTHAQDPDADVDDTGRGWKPVTTDMASHLPFSAAVEANGFVFVSGQASVDNNGQILSGSFEDEMRRSMQNVSDILQSAGLTLDNVVRVTSYVHDPVDLPKYNELYRDYFSRPYPARTTITSCLTAALKFEIDVIAVRPS